MCNIVSTDAISHQKHPKHQGPGWYGAKDHQYISRLPMGVFLSSDPFLSSHVIVLCLTVRSGGGVGGDGWVLVRDLVRSAILRTHTIGVDARAAGRS
jgi:hypothetical protein